MRILVACRKIGGVVGGVERMVTTLISELSERGHHVSLFSWDEEGAPPPFYPVPDKMSWYRMELGNPAVMAGWKLRLSRAMRVRRILKHESPDVILAFQEGAFVTLQLYGLGLGIPVICAIRNSPFRDAKIPVYPPMWVTSLVMGLSAAVTVQFPRYAEAFPLCLRRKFRTIPNHVTPAEERAAPDADISPKMILCTGRLSPEKDHASLVRAFALIAPKYPDWELVLVGRGDEEGILRDLVAGYPDDVARRIILAGVSDDVPSWLRRAHIFAFPSWWEGFPNSLAEAMAHGLPCVGYKECDGVSDLIDDNVTGLLAQGTRNPESLSQCLDTLMKDSVLRRELGDAGFNKSQKFLPELVLTQWEDLLSDVAKRRAL